MSTPSVASEARGSIGRRERNRQTGFSCRTPSQRVPERFEADGEAVGSVAVMVHA